MSALLELAERCEKATGPDRELDRAIFDAITGGVFGPENKQFWHSTNYTSRAANRFTASIDAAMSLVPEGCDFGVGRGLEEMDGEYDASQGWAWCGKGEGPFRYAATPTLALCAAALRARGEGGGNG